MVSISAIEGIGPKYRKVLQDSGVRTCEGLLARGATKKGRSELATLTKLGDTRILEWVNRADLMRIKGVSSQYSDLLEAAGVDTVKELKRRRADNLTTAMEETNAKKKNKLVKRTPSIKVVQGWIDQAKALPAIVKY